jgi:hyperosmotically inducible periplasmic protein
MSNARGVPRRGNGEPEGGVIMRNSFLIGLSMALTMGATIVACTSQVDTLIGSSTPASVVQSADYVDDAVINSTVRSALRSERGLIGGRIDVASFQDVVQLGGFVPDEQAKLRAGEVAAAVPGVKSVDNNLVAK